MVTKTVTDKVMKKGKRRVEVRTAMLVNLLYHLGSNQDIEYQGRGHVNQFITYTKWENYAVPLNSKYNLNIN